MRTSLKSLAIATALATLSFTAAPAFAQDEEASSPVTITGNAAIVSDYRFRGVSLSAGDPAIQGGFDIGIGDGLYVGTWGSSLDANTDYYGATEIDVYGGWTGDIAPGITANVGMLYYYYPNDDNSGPTDLFEPYASLATT